MAMGEGGSLLSILKLPYQEIFDAMPGYALIIDSDYRVLQTNQRFVEDFGPSQGHICHRSVTPVSR